LIIPGSLGIALLFSGLLIPMSHIWAESDDNIIGQVGSDTLVGRDGNDEIEGDEGDDELLGRKGDDSLTGQN
jgi:Ca2+-binding RTX toxin-like protein